MKPASSVSWRSRRWLLGVAALVVIGGAIAVLIVSGVGSDDRAGDVDRQRDFYSRFPQFPGSVVVSSEDYEITADGRGTGDFGLRVVYRLPAEATSTGVSDFFRSTVPPGWKLADDTTCATRMAQIVEPPPDPYWTGSTQPSVHSLDWRLINERSRITVLAPPATDVHSGVTFVLSRDGGAKLLTVDRVQLSCAPMPEADTMADTAADQFDQP